MRLSRFTSSPFRLFVIVPISILWVGWLYGANLRAQWSVFDDHEIMWFTGTAQRLPPNQIFSKLMLTEVGPQSDLPRFRPAYYTLRLLETSAWGRHPDRWYAAHLAIFAFFLATIWAVASSRIGLLASGFLVGYISTLPFWSGIFSALGPGETYATLGLALFLWGADCVLRRRRPGLGWCLLLGGTLIATGSKENMLVLTLPLLLLLWNEVRNKGTTGLAVVVVSVNFAWAAWIATVVLHRVQAAGSDLYASPVGMRQRLAVVWALLGNASLLGLLALACLFWASWLALRRQHSALRRMCMIALAWAILLSVLYASQFLFYNGVWPTGTRYDFPGMLAWPAMLLVVAWFINDLGELPHNPMGRPLVQAAIAVLSLGMLVAGSSGIRVSQTIAERNVAATTAWTRRVEQISTAAREHEGSSLVVQSNDPADFEPAIAFPRFLEAYGARNPTFLIWTPRREGVVNYLGSLSDQLEKMSQDGVPGAYLPVAQLDSADTNCILIVMSGRSRWPCRITMEADWRAYYQ